MYSKFEVHRSRYPLTNIEVKFGQDQECYLRLNRRLMKNQLENNMDMSCFHRRLVNISLKILAIEFEYVYLEWKQCAKLDMCRVR